MEAAELAVMEFYKYYSSEFDSSVKSGSIYLNTFVKIRDLDESNFIGDSQEATSIHDVDLKLGISTPATEWFVSYATGGMVEIEGSDYCTIKTSSVTRVLPDAFMFCVTSERNDDLWENEYRYDKCMRIRDFYLLCESISIALYNQGIPNEYICDKCIYDSKRGKISNSEFNIQEPSYFRKRPQKEFEMQNEYRAVFIPKDNRLKIEPKSLYVGIDNFEFLK